MGMGLPGLLLPGTLFCGLLGSLGIVLELGGTAGLLVDGTSDVSGVLLGVVVPGFWACILVTSSIATTVTRVFISGKFQLQ